MDAMGGTYSTHREVGNLTFESENPKENDHFVRSRCRCENNIKMSESVD